MTGLGYRGLASTIPAEDGFEEPHVGLQLPHANDNKTKAAYNSALYLAQRTVIIAAGPAATAFPRENRFALSTQPSG